MGVDLTDGLLWLAGAFLFVHLLTDARRMVQVLRLRHSRKAHKPRSGIPCQRCKGVDAGIKEAWWEVATLVALVGHLIFDYIG
jgi:hypothetical protein